MCAPPTVLWHPPERPWNTSVNTPRSVPEHPIDGAGEPIWASYGAPYGAYRALLSPRGPYMASNIVYAFNSWVGAFSHFPFGSRREIAMFKINENHRLSREGSKQLS